jgi:hypothetical protein
MTARRLLLAGSVGPERVPARPDPDYADWYLPLHLRDERGARECIAAQVAAGADVVVAPTWLTHRRALMPLGETRRAGAWTTAAVGLAREAIEIGLERREEALAEAPQQDIRRGRPTPLLAASLPALDDEPEPATGRLLPREAATERDYRDQAGALADAEPDLILVEGQRAEADAHTAIAESAETGLPVWAALSPSALASTDTEGWLEWAGAAAVTRLLLPPPLAARLPAADGPLPWGALVPVREDLADWLDAGASAVALLDGATVPTVEALRTVVDDHERVAIEAEQAERRRWGAHLSRAAAMAPGGPAVWVGAAAEEELPAGFEWSRVERHELPHLPRDRFRLAIDREGAPDTALARTLERGGIAVARPGSMPELRLVALDENAEPALAIYRRED